MKQIIAASALAFVGSGAFASEFESTQDFVVDCLSRMEAGTTWDQCRTILFSDCKTDTIGSPEHLSCLTTQREDWRVYLNDYTVLLNRKLTTEGSLQLNNLVGQWFGYVGNQCASVAESFKETGPEAARLGCEISEYAGMAAEFAACLDGRSVAPYCEIKE